MRKLAGKLAVALALAVIAMPLTAYAQGAGGGAPVRSGGGGGGGVHVGGGGGGVHVGGGGGRSFGGFSAARPATRSFTPHAGGRTFTSHIGTRTYVGRSTQFRTMHRGTTFSRSVQGAQRLRTVTQPNTALRTLRRTTGVRTNALRRNGTAGITPLAAQQGRFGSRFAGRAGNRFANVAAHRAWRRGLRAGFVPWYGPVFWPYAYSDIFDYAFWPNGYDDGFWDYAYDDFVDGLFWGEYGPPEIYAYARPAGPRVSYAGVQELCKQPGTGITAWPFAEIQRKVGLSDEQKQLLGDMRKAAADAAATFKASCPAENVFPLTPPGRLTAMTGRLQATLDAVKVVQPALDKFYNSLSDEQKERFNALGPKRVANNAETAAALPHDSKSCSEAKPGLANLPIEKIDEVVKPTGAQEDGLKQLQDATSKAVSLLQAACPEETPLTPPGRLAAMEKRLQAMVDAASAVKPALDSFYSSLSNEQKARFDRIGQQLAESNG
jgi:ABC-type transporter MlaC component